MTFEARAKQALIANSNGRVEDFILFDKQSETIDELVLRSHPYCRLIFSGSQPLEIVLGTNTSITLPSNELLFLAPYIFYRLSPRKEAVDSLSVRFAPATNFFISAYWDDARTLLQRAQHGLHFNATATNEIYALYNELYNECSLSHVCKIITIFDILSKNLPANNVLSDSFPRQERDQRFCQVTEEYIQGHLESNISVVEMADKLHLSVSSFHQKFRQYFDCSFHNYLLQKKIEHACRLLDVTNMTVAEIAERLNFSSPSHFTSAFKRFCHTTPRLYRQESQNNTADNREAA
ncbi:helix-turn-helix transcriptional regulator [Wielerella bovis]|uniref:helix-turn-helix transcriptional regulator n=1 Tax=Wielerella bovis TaxID=2917790 RepID=UPI0020184E27|nr:AraC family transcriptional regulator [Wielerella bovis]MCG7657523.1 AraC family transcriptional regulator [Wielerella bovis]MCG7659744.1 AraC family transcriptional regulator [Wielerella bovis]ULJ59677.1 AraC family transcriptional regulator [Wielerella bovis]ULJ61915.1 AraC family transcriptional regulator [Wielerella bovis]ULJ64102.1 AraC family transcriptional regulator [Wielerella bovis]